MSQKSFDIPDPPQTVTPPLQKILDKHGATLEIKGKRKTPHKKLAEDLIAELEVEKTRGAAVQANLNAILSQWQVASQSMKALQAAHEELSQKYQAKLLKADSEDDNGGPAADGAAEPPTT